MCSITCRLNSALQMRLRIFANFPLLVVIFRHITCLEYTFERFEIENGKSYREYAFNITVYRVAKFNRTTNGITLEGELYNDLGSNHSLEVLFYYNRLNNMQYTRTPAHIPKSPICDVLDKFYKTHWMEIAKDVSNLPQLKDGERLCPLSKVAQKKNDF